MKINYKRKKIWKSLIVIFGIIIFSLSLFYTNDLVKKIEIEENKKMDLWVKSQKELIENEYVINKVSINNQQIIISGAIENSIKNQHIISHNQYMFNK